MLSAWGKNWLLRFCYALYRLQVQQQSMDSTQHSAALHTSLHGPTHAHAAIKRAGTAGGEAQQNDIRSLRREIELKKVKLNELREETKRKENSISRVRDDRTDAQRLTPGASVCQCSMHTNLSLPLGAV